MELQRKEFTFEVKAGENRVIEGYAATYGNRDSVDDIILPGAFTESLSKRKLKMLAQHDTYCVIGKWNEIVDDSTGLKVRGTFSKTARADEYYELAKDGAVDSLSIGYSVIEAEYEGDIRIIKKAELWEVSLVTFPANERAKITNVKDALPKTEREFERFLRDAGYSQKAAKKITAEGYKALNPHRDDEVDDAKAVEAKALDDRINAAINILKGN